MKAKKAMKKINKALDYDMDSVIVLGVDKDGKTFYGLTYGKDEELVNLVLNLFDKEPKFADVVLKVSAMKKLNQIVTGESDEED